MLATSRRLTARAPILGCAQRLASTVSKLPVLDGTEALTRWRAALPPPAAESILAGYSSVLGGITTDPSLLMVPMDDHGFHRGHCVFDTCHVEGGRAFGLSMHLDRLLRSAATAQILAPGGSPPLHFAREELRSIILQTIAATGRRDGVFVRYWLSAGRGDFNISPKACVGGPSFYVVACVHAQMRARLHLCGALMHVHIRVLMHACVCACTPPLTHVRACAATSTHTQQRNPGESTRPLYRCARHAHAAFTPYP